MHGDTKIEFWKKVVRRETNWSWKEGNKTDKTDKTDNRVLVLKGIRRGPASFFLSFFRFFFLLGELLWVRTRSGFGDSELVVLPGKVGSFRRGNAFRLDSRCFVILSLKQVSMMMMMMKIRS